MTDNFKKMIESMTSRYMSLISREELTKIYKEFNNDPETISKEIANYIKFYMDKGCVNCICPICSIPYNEKIGYEDGFPIGNKCLFWENDEYLERKLQLK